MKKWVISIVCVCVFVAVLFMALAVAGCGHATVTEEKAEAATAASAVPVTEEAEPTSTPEETATQSSSATGEIDPDELHVSSPYRYYILEDGSGIILESCGWKEGKEEEVINLPPEVDGWQVKVIGYNVLHKKDAKVVNIPQGVEEIEACAFMDSKIGELNIPASVKTISGNPIAGCKTVQISVAPENEYFCVRDGVLFSKDMTVLVARPLWAGKDYVIPDRVTTIGEGAFAWFGYSGEPETLTIPASVVHFPEGMFIADGEPYRVHYFAGRDEKKDLTLLVESGSAAEEFAKAGFYDYEVI